MKIKQLLASAGWLYSCLWLGAAPVLAAEVTPLDHIVWLQADASKPNPLVAFLSERLPAIRHQLLAANAIRSWQMVQRGEAACRPTTVHTAQRDREAYFIDTMLAPPAALVVRRARLDQVPRNPAGEADLTALVASNRLRGAFARGRSYGDAIDQLLARQQGNRMLVDYAMAGYGARLQDMLAQDRADYLIESRGALDLMRQRELAANAFVELPIQGSTTPLVLGIACPRTPWGQAAARAIDQAIATPEGVAHLRESTAAWFSPAEKQRLGPELEAFYARRSRRQFTP